MQRCWLAQGSYQVLRADDSGLWRDDRPWASGSLSADQSHGDQRPDSYLCLGLGHRWVFFFLEITAALLYLYGWDKLEPRLHQWYG